MLLVGPTRLTYKQICIMLSLEHCVVQHHCQNTGVTVWWFFSTETQGIKFETRVFSGEKDGVLHIKDNNQIVLEIHKLYGCNFQMRTLFQKLCTALETIELAPLAKQSPILKLELRDCVVDDTLNGEFHQVVVSLVNQLSTNGAVAKLLLGILSGSNNSKPYLDQLQQCGFLKTALDILSAEAVHCNDADAHTLDQIQCLLLLTTNVVMTMPERSKWLDSEQSTQFQPVVGKLCRSIPGLMAPPALYDVRILFGDK